MMDELLAILDGHARREPRRTAIREPAPGGGRRAVARGELLAGAAWFAAEVARRCPEDALVALVMPRSATGVAGMLGALAAGRAFAHVPPSFRTARIRAVTESGGPVLAVADPATARQVGVTDGETRGSARWWVVADPPGGGRSPAGAAPAAGDPARPGACLFTSGSTGRPGGVLVSVADLGARARHEIDLFGLTPDDRLLGVLPFSFDVGLNQLLSGLAAGATLVLLRSWLPADLLAAAADAGVTGISATPSIWQGLLASGLAFDRSGPHRALRYVTVSGGDLAPAHLRRLPDAVGGAGIYKTYGQTETFRTTALRPSEFAARPTSVGRPVAGVRARIDEATGEVVHAGMGVMLGYRDPGHRDEAGPPPAEIRTGDLGRFDAEGYLFLEGRRDDLVKVMGNRVHPAELARWLAGRRGVAAAEAVAVPDEDAGHRLAGFVVAAPGERLDPEELRRRAARELPAWLAPKTVVRRSALPLLPNGKPDRRALRRAIPGPDRPGEEVEP